jgi:hypothetical protein
MTTGGITGQLTCQYNSTVYLHIRTEPEPVCGWVVSRYRHDHHHQSTRYIFVIGYVKTHWCMHVGEWLVSTNCFVLRRSVVLFSLWKLLVTFQVLMVAIMKVAAFWDTAPCSLIEVDRRFRGAYCPRHQSLLSPSPWWWWQNTPLKRRAASTTLDGAISQKALIWKLLILMEFRIVFLGPVRIIHWHRLQVFPLSCNSTLYCLCQRSPKWEPWAPMGP